MSWCIVSQAVSRAASRGSPFLVSSSPYFSKPGKRFQEPMALPVVADFVEGQGAAYDSVPQFAVVGRGAGAANTGAGCGQLGVCPRLLSA